MRATLVGLCFVAGMFALLLLNGQTFSNALFALGMVAAGIGLCVPPILDRGRPWAKHRPWAAVALLYGVVAAVLIANLPTAYRFQSNFNEKMRQARVASMHAVK